LYENKKKKIFLKLKQKKIKYIKTNSIYKDFWCYFISKNVVSLQKVFSLLESARVVDLRDSVSDGFILRH
jgi:hypothetical protein